MEREVSDLIDTALARRSYLVGMLSRASSSDVSEALKIEFEIAELDGLLTLVTRTSAMH